MFSIANHHSMMSGNLINIYLKRSKSYEALRNADIYGMVRLGSDSKKKKKKTSNKVWGKSIFFHPT
jgi:hypothetical protein